jgi:hypothetical protein
MLPRDVGGVGPAPPTKAEAARPGRASRIVMTQASSTPSSTCTATATRCASRSQARLSASGPTPGHDGCAAAAPPAHAGRVTSSSWRSDFTSAKPVSPPLRCVLSVTAMAATHCGLSSAGCSKLGQGTAERILFADSRDALTVDPKLIRPKGELPGFWSLPGTWTGWSAVFSGTLTPEGGCHEAQTIHG